MTVSRRVAAIEGSLDPLAIVLKVIAECLEYGSLEACARAIAEGPVEAAPISRIGADVEASVRAALKGRPRDEINDQVRLAVGDAVFRFHLFMRLNTSALEIADHEGLRASAVFYWMGCLLGGPREHELEPAEWVDHQREQAECWQTWRQVVASLLLRVVVEEEAREQLEARYLGGQSALFAGAEDAWDRLAQLVDQLWSIGNTLPTVPEPAGDPSGDDPLADRVADRARHLADDARISAFERLDELPRAVAIVERRLGTRE
jgi:hypothetical protein